MQLTGWIVRRRGARWIALAALAAALLLASLALLGRGREELAASEAGSLAAHAPPDAPPQDPRPRRRAAGLPLPTPEAPDPGDDRSLGYIPAAEVDQPPDLSSAQETPEILPPPDPAEHPPPLHNPGGVNGDRPERPAP